MTSFISDMKNAYTVTDVTKYIKNMFAQDFVLNSVKVCGEVSNCKYHTSGHIYFTLKDEKSQIACVMFASDRHGLKFQMTDGQQVEIEGRVDIYERNGAYQLYARKITKEGAGDLYLKFEALKTELMERGMFAEEYKRPVPKYIRTLGVVTAPTGAAVQDIINIAARRNPYVQIILYPAQVQGEGAAESIVKGIHELERINVDVMIVGRGGGSMEDLWAFNEEIVAEAIFESSVPVISAVGHETDFTIADFAADLRAPTPSAAAELAVLEFTRIEEYIRQLRDDLDASMYAKIRSGRDRCERLSVRMRSLSPANRLLQNKTYCMNLEDKLQAAFEKQLTHKRHRLEMYIEKLGGLSPLGKLNQGYLVAVGANGSRIRRTTDVSVGDPIKLYVSDGYITGRVDGTVKGKNKI